MHTYTRARAQLAGTYNQWGTFASVVTGCLYRSHDCSCTLAFCPIASIVCPARTSITARAEDRVIASHRVRKARKVGNGINRRHTLTSLLIETRVRLYRYRISRTIEFATRCPFIKEDRRNTPVLRNWNRRVTVICGQRPPLAVDDRR